MARSGEAPRADLHQNPAQFPALPEPDPARTPTVRAGSRGRLAAQSLCGYLVEPGLCRQLLGDLDAGGGRGRTGPRPGRPRVAELPEPPGPLPGPEGSSAPRGRATARAAPGRAPGGRRPRT